MPVAKPRGTTGAAFEAVTIKGTLNSFKIVGEMLNAMRSFSQSKDGIKPLLEKTCENWEEPVKFTEQISRAGGVLYVRVYTDNQIWNWVDKGTRGNTGDTDSDANGTPYTIEAGTRTPDAAILGLPMVWEPKTRTGKLDSGPGARSGLSPAKMHSVEHFGIRPRMFSETVAEMERKGGWFRRAMQTALNRAMVQSPFGLKK